MPHATPTPFPVWPGEPPDGALWADAGPPLERPLWENSRVVRNVSVPTLTAFLPEPATATGAAVVVCPGGAFHFLMVDKEGTEVARWLNARGVAAFVLAYRVHPTPDADPLFLRLAADLGPHRAAMERAKPVVVADGAQAVRVVRARAAEWGVDPGRVGIVGFSAGGHLAVGVASRHDAGSRPDFAAAVYPPRTGLAVPADAPPLFLAAAADDPLVDARDSLAIAEAWLAAGRPAELHLYAAGGHGFALWPTGRPVDGWAERWWAWLADGGFVG